MLKAYKYKIKPNKQQEELLLNFFGCTRFIYNWGLNKKTIAYKENGKSINYVQLAKEMTSLKQTDEYKWLKECTTEALQQSLRSLDKAFTAFFRKKAQLKIAKLFERIMNKKDAYIHYVANELLSYFDTVFMEDLNVKGMLRNHHLAKAISEVGFYKFKEILVNKSLVNDKQVVFVDRFYPSSKTCSVCGYKKQDLKLSDREWICPKCGTKHDRDINAAMNILLEGQRMLTV